MRMKYVDLDDDEPLKPFITTVLDQAYDGAQYNEMSGYLLLEMTKFFLAKLEINGYGNTSKTADFKGRYKRARIFLKKAIDDLREIERLILKHLEERPVLKELPIFLRALIHIKIGLADRKNTAKILHHIVSLLGSYARARSAVAFDFNRLPSYHHGLRLRQSIILSLQKDVLKYTLELFEEEFRAVKEEFENMLSEIEASAESLDPKSPEYEELMKKKAAMQKRFEEQRRKLDVVKNQGRLIDVQHKMINDSIKRYNDQEAVQKKIDEEIKSRPKIDTKSSLPTRKKVTRMAITQKRDL